MTPKEEALRLLRQATPRPEVVETVALLEAPGRVLAEDVTSDMDQPPFDRAAMDGYAVRADDFAAGLRDFEVAGVVAAGEVSAVEVAPGLCAKIMTGAPLPAGADAVVMVELSRETGPGRVRLDAEPRSGENVAPRGQDMRAGEVVLRAGTPLRPLEIGILASVGRAEVPVWRRPRVAVIATGDELIPPAAGLPGPGKIRESNGSMLAAQAASLGAGIVVRHLGIARDEPAAVRAMLEEGARDDVVILSGGVSMGDFDHVHHELKARGLEVVIEKVAIKPGKPLLFGRLATAEGRTVHVFGLPGNPVSSFVTFELFVRPFLRGLSGFPEPQTLVSEARLGSAVRARPIPRTQHLPARVVLEDGELVAEPVAWHGSGDLRGLLDANAFIVVPAGEAPPAPPGRVEVLLLEAGLLRLPPHRSRG